MQFFVVSHLLAPQLNVVRELEALQNIALPANRLFVKKTQTLLDPFGFSIGPIINEDFYLFF